MPLADLQSRSALDRQGFLLRSGGEGCAETNGAAARRFAESWDRLVTDAYMQPGDEYRQRRYARFSIDPDGVVTKLPHRAFTQSSAINSYAGDRPREFAAMEDAVCDSPMLARLLRRESGVLAAACLDGAPAWHVDVHQVRTIATQSAFGLPSPEGPHRDGMFAVGVVLIDRAGITGGESVVLDDDGTALARFTLRERFESYMVLDERVLHDVTPVRICESAEQGTRDTLLLGFRPYTTDLDESGYAYGG